MSGLRCVRGRCRVAGEPSDVELIVSFVDQFQKRTDEFNKMIDVLMTVSKVFALHRARIEELELNVEELKREVDAG